MSDATRCCIASLQRRRDLIRYNSGYLCPRGTPRTRQGPKDQRVSKPKKPRELRELGAWSLLDHGSICQVLPPPYRLPNTSLCRSYSRSRLVHGPLTALVPSSHLQPAILPAASSSTGPIRQVVLTRFTHMLATSPSRAVLVPAGCIHSHTWVGVLWQ